MLRARGGAVLVVDDRLREVAATGSDPAELALLRSALGGPGDATASIGDGRVPVGLTEPVRAAIHDAAEGGTGGSGSVRSGGRTWCWSVRGLDDDGGGRRQVLAELVDMSDIDEEVSRLDVAAGRFAAAFDNAPIGMALVGLDGRFLQVNRSLCEILDADSADLVDMTFQDITHPDDLNVDLGHAERLISGEISSYRMEKRYFDSRGRIVWVQLSGSLVRGPDGQPSHFIAQIEDICERKRHEERLTRQAQRDALTGLRNRATFDRDLAGYVRAAERFGDLCALLLIDLDGFKAVNDEAGHEAGDAVLRRVSAAILGRVRLSDHAYRIGGDEFCVLLPHTSTAAAEVVAESIRHAIAEIPADGACRQVGASVGVAAVEAGTASPMARADAALYREKAAKAR